MGFMLPTPNSGSMPYKLDGLCSDDRNIDCLKEKALLRAIKFFEKMPKQTRNTVSNAHKMIPPAPPFFVWQIPCFALGNPKIIRIKS